MPNLFVEFAASNRESAIVQIMAKRTCSSSVSSLFASSRPQGWAELPDDLLQPVAALLRAFRDLLAFGATCRPWRDLLSARTPSLQPLLLHPSADSKLSPQFNRWTTLQGCTWRLADPAAASSYPSLLSLSDLRSMTFLRYSYGQLIFYDNNGFHIVNPFSGAKLGPPSLQSIQFTCISYVTLTAPVASTDSHLLVGAGAYLFLWRIGSDSWLEHYPKVLFVKSEQIVARKGKTYALGSFGSFCIIQLSPMLLIQKFEVVLEKHRTKDHYWTNQKTWIVVFGYVLLLIKLEEGGKIS